VLTPSNPAAAIISTFSSSDRSMPSVWRRSIAQSDCSTNSLCSSCADTFSPPALILLRTVPARAQP
jgi:hypothetical protein